MMVEAVRLCDSWAALTTREVPANWSTTYIPYAAISLLISSLGRLPLLLKPKIHIATLFVLSSCRDSLVQRATRSYVKLFSEVSARNRETRTYPRFDFRLLAVACSPSTPRRLASHFVSFRQLKTCHDQTSARRFPSTMFSTFSAWIWCSLQHHHVS